MSDCQSAGGFSVSSLHLSIVFEYMDFETNLKQLYLPLTDNMLISKHIEQLIFILNVMYVVSIE